MSDERGPSVYESPLGPLTIVAAADGRLRRIRFPNEGEGSGEESGGATGRAIAQLEEYVSGERHSFDL